MTDTQPSASAKELLHQLAATRESRQLLADLIPELLQVWADSGTGAGMARSTARKSIAGLAGNSVKNAFLDQQGLAEATPLKDLAAEPDFFQAAAGQTGTALDAIFATLTESLAGMDALETRQKKELFGLLLTELLSGRGAPLLTAVSRTLTEIHREDAAFLARTLEPCFRRWVEGLDFGEVKEAMDSSEESLSALVSMANTVLWEYPAKVITILSLLPPVLNMTLEALANTVNRFNEKGSPDLVADVILSLLRETRADILAAVINETAEMIRRFHTGSALIGEPGAPQLPNDLFALFNDTLDQVDGATLWKARTALAEIRQAAGGAMTDALVDHPDLMTAGLTNNSEIRNTRIRAVNHRLSALDNLDPDTLHEALGQTLSGLDVQEAAEAVNNTAFLTNRFLEAIPEAITEKTAAFAEAVDPHEISDLLEQIGERAGEAVKPLARAVVPHLIRGVLAALEPDDDEFGPTAAEARDRLLSFFNPQEA